jgi:DNA-directed RNA polymerase subunit RPC12/RpoP
MESMASSQRPHQVEHNGYVYKYDVIRGPTIVYVCDDCGHRLGRYKLANGRYQYRCEECDDTYHLHYKYNKINKHRVNMWGE